MAASDISSGKEISAVDKKRGGSGSTSSKIGGCAGVFFNLFDWNRRLNAKRLLPHRLLPSERPSKSIVKSTKDEKLPMAKLLLIADENRGGFPKSPGGSALEASLREKTPEKKKKKRSPNVVAKLMGLETMPSPEPRKDKKKSQYVDENTLLTLGQNGPTKPSKSRFSDENSQALVSHKSEELKSPLFLYKFPALSPRKPECPFRSILSPSKSHNKLLSPIKSPLGTKRLFEAAARILETNMQPTTRARASIGIGSRTSRHVLSDSSYEEDKSGNKESRLNSTSRRKCSPASLDSSRKTQTVSSRLYPDQGSKAQTKPKQEKRVNLSTPEHSTTSRFQRSNTISSSQEASKKSVGSREETLHRLSRAKSARDDSLKSSGTGSNNKDLKSVKDDKPKTLTRKQQPVANKSNQQQQLSSSKRRVSSSPKSETEPAVRKSMSQLEIQEASRAEVDTTRRLSMDSSVVTTSSTSNSAGGILNYSRLFSSRKSLASDSSRKSEKKGDSSLVKALLRKKKEGSTAGVGAKLDQKVKADQNLETLTAPQVDVSHDSTSSAAECITTEVVFDDIDDTASTAGTLENAGLPTKFSSNVDIQDRDSDVGNAEQFVLEASEITPKKPSVDEDNSYSCQSSCLSSSGDVVDSASSGTSSDVQRYSRKHVSYSGKTTAAILQELLSALNTSRAPLSLDSQLQNMFDSSQSLSSSPDVTMTPQQAAGSPSQSTSEMVSSMLRHSRKQREGSPISVFDAPFDDDDVSSDSLLSSHEKRLQRISFTAQSSVGSRRCNIDVQNDKTPYESEEQYVKQIVASAKLSPVDVYAARLNLPSLLVDPAVFNNMEKQYSQQWEWGVCSDGNDRSLMKKCYEEAAIQNRKLVFDCSVEALSSDLGLNTDIQIQLGHPPKSHLSPAYLSKNVYKQLNNWRDVACNMNVDDVVEKDMNAGFGKWDDFSNEVSELAVEMEDVLVKGLIDELVLDMCRNKSSRCVMRMQRHMQQTRVV